MNIQHFDDKALLFMHTDHINLLALLLFFFPTAYCTRCRYRGSRKYECLVMPWRSFSFFNPGQSAIFSFLSFFSPSEAQFSVLLFFLTLGQGWLRIAGNGGDRDRKHLPGKHSLKS